MLKKPEKLIFDLKSVKKEIGLWYKEVQSILDKHRVWETCDEHTRRWADCEKNNLIWDAECIRWQMMSHAFGEKYWNARFVELQELIEKIENYPN